jgi:small-conductance mechanosensitive channel
MVRVRDMGIRATVARTLNDEDLVIPNSVIVQSCEGP